MKAIAWLLGVAGLVAAGVYSGVSLVRWEWTRALFFAIVFVAAEIGLVAGLLLDKLDKLVAHDRHGARDRAGGLALGGGEGGATMRPAAEILRTHRGDGVRFAWLRTDPAEFMGRTNVFVTVMVGGGVLLSAGAWALDKIASHTTEPRREARLGRDLDRIAYRRGLVVDEVTALARREPRREEPHTATLLGRRR
jgi:hypothetical protein